MIQLMTDNMIVHSGSISFSRRPVFHLVGELRLVLIHTEDLVQISRSRVLRHEVKMLTMGQVRLGVR
jgi:hypothetical protein